MRRSAHPWKKERINVCAASAAQNCRASGAADAAQNQPASFFQGCALRRTPGYPRKPLTRQYVRRLRRRRSAFRTPTTAAPATAEAAASFRAVAFGTRRRSLGIRPRNLWRTGRTRLARRPRLLRSGSGRIRSGFFATISATAATTSPARPLSLSLRRSCVLLRRTLLLLRRTLWLALRTLRTTIASTLARLLLLRTRAAAALVLLTRTLFELLNLPLHVLADRPVLAGPHLVETAVGTAFPAFGIRLLTGCAKDTFWQRHWRAGRIVHFRPCSLRPTPSAVKPCGR